MEHKDDEIQLNLADGREVIMSRYNTRLFTFLGSNATRNHVFIGIEEREETVQGAYVFAHSEHFAQLARFIFDKEFPMSLNSLDVPAGDEEAFQRSLEQLTGDGVDDFIPDEFFNE